MVNVVVIISLVILAVQDIRRKCIGIRVTAGLGLLSLVYGLYRLNFGDVSLSPMLIVAGIVFVAFLLIMSVGLKALGIGDVVVACMLLLVKGVVFTVSAFMVAVTLMAVVVTFLLIKRKVRRKTTVAFLPYMTLGALGVMIWA